MSENATQASATGYKPHCERLPDAPTVPALPKPPPCPGRCDCPDPPTGKPQDCFDDLIRDQNILVRMAERAKVYADELTGIQGRVTSAQADYTQARFIELRKAWKEQDDAIDEILRKLVCAVGCWECLLECRLCRQLVEIRRLEDCLNGEPAAAAGGTGRLATQAYSLYDQHAWHQRNVAQMTARLKRITEVLAAWEKPSSTLGDALEQNAALIKEVQNLIASDPAQAMYDVFMTLIPRHWAIRPRGPGLEKEWESRIDEQYLRICDCPAPGQQEDGKPQASAQDGDQSGDADRGCRCDDGIPDDCCGPDVGVPTLREDLIGPLPYLVDPAIFPAMICCLTRCRLTPASDQLAQAQANLAAAEDAITLTKKQIADKRAAIEANFKAALSNPIDCCQFPWKPAPPAAPPRDGAGQGGASQGGTSEGGVSQGGTSEGGASQGSTSQGGTSEGGTASLVSP